LVALSKLRVSLSRLKTARRTRPETEAREEMTADASLGPIQYIVLGFPGNKFKGEIIPALADLVEAGIIRIMDLAFVRKDADGSVLILELEDLADDEAAPFGAFEKEIGDLLNEDDLRAAAAALEPGSSAAALIWENVWARKFADAVRGADGMLMAWHHIPYEAVQAVMAAAKKPAE
jgi:uncharacterized membrane protein